MKNKIIKKLVISSVLIALSQTGMAESITSENTQSNKEAWISIGADALSLINQNYSQQFNLSQVNLHNAPEGSVAVVRIKESKINELSEFMHEKFNRCGGFIFHESFEEAQAFAMTPSQMVPSVAVNYTIDNAAGVNALLNELSASNLTSTVNSLSNYNNRYYTSQSGVDAANWIKNKWSTMSNGRSDISVATYSHSFSQPSVIATITGTTTPNEIVILGGHLDSINQSSPSAGRAPGADDNASGIAVVTETLNAIIASGFKPKRTIKLIGYAAEEVGLRGSKDIAQNYKNNNQDVVGVVQFDMSGYKGTTGKDIVFMTDYTNNAQNQFMAQLIDTYLTGVNYGYDQCGYGCSDHASWHNQGYAASMPFESNMNNSNPSIHTSNDTSFNQNHSFNFAKLSAAFVGELAKGSTGTTPPPPPPPSGNKLENKVAKTGLSASTGNALNYTFEVPAGSTNINFVMSGGSGDADMYVKFGSAPTDSSYDCRPYKSGNAETCTGTQTGGTYHVRLKAYSTFSNVSITASYDGSTPPPTGNDPIDDTTSNISVGQGQWARYTQVLPAGYSSLTVTISGGSGDADLYVRRGAQSTTSLYDCRPYKNGNNETCTFNAPAAGTWYIDLYGYSTASGVTLNVKANP